MIEKEYTRENEDGEEEVFAVVFSGRPVVMGPRSFMSKRTQRILEHGDRAAEWRDE